MASAQWDLQKVPAPDLRIIVCIDGRRCLNTRSHGRNGLALFRGLGEVVKEQGLEHRVRVTPCRCIFGCTYGPRVDITKTWSGEKVLYGTSEGELAISIRGKVRMQKIPADLVRLIFDNLAEGEGKGEAR